ncbi:hypothetical protein KDX16_30970 [Burkholderia vietnamiensis]|uniref:hypothetical protein n=1 Tax=Burkholderia vietnamiensis TaxID=60552 RepID=UPI00075B31DB|nr:hypothetical protein [Burkholderia vietnamiensis]KVR89521.1 hypothetical protein WK28_24230 [Burkholderia vietnamiensis]MBR7920223.1 hypothetical protein [Burkholderia vietnamiensis]MBR8205311.1 hypothetical protein [Burkholderia vietnamiensis]HDR9133233.1 hypothetical protein [Burkholderia vietnamiensis]
MNEYVTIVVRKPTDESGMQQVKQGLELLRPFQTAMSLEDEMTVLELIEQHPDFDEAIAEDARRRTTELHMKAALTS